VLKTRISCIISNPSGFWTPYFRGPERQHRDESLGTRGIGDEVFVALARSNILALITSLLPSLYYNLKVPRNLARNNALGNTVNISCVIDIMSDLIVLMAFHAGVKEFRQLPAPPIAHSAPSFNPE
jgi:hypothetical protein